MQSFLDMAIPGLRCLNPGCRAAAPVGNPITFRRILYDGWTCSRCGEEYSGVYGVDGPVLLPDRAETEAAGAEVALGLVAAEEPNDSGSQKMSEFGTNMADKFESKEGEVKAEDFNILDGGGASAEGDQEEVEQPRSIYDMNRGELVAELDRFELDLGDVPVRGKALSNNDIRAYIVTHVPVYYGSQQNEQEQESE